MVTSEAIALANEIVQAQKIAQINKLSGGVFLCVDTTKGKYQFVDLGDVMIGTKPLHIILEEKDKAISLLERKLTAANARVSKVEEDMSTLKTKMALAIQTLEQKITELQEEGDPL